jgi:hypothetical protein
MGLGKQIGLGVQYGLSGVSDFGMTAFGFLLQSSDWVLGKNNTCIHGLAYDRLFSMRNDTLSSFQS